LKRAAFITLILCIILIQANAYAHTESILNEEDFITGDLDEKTLLELIKEGVELEPEVEISEEMEDELLEEMEEELIQYEFEPTPNYEKYLEIVGSKEKKVRKFDLSDGVAEQVPVLIYHHLLKDEENPYENNTAVLDVDLFNEHMSYLYKHGFTTLTLYELEQFILGELEVPKKSVVITFDDGYASNFHYAYPILKKYKFKASMFLITHKIPDEAQKFTPERSIAIGWDQIVKASDVFEYANHTHDFHKMTEDGIPYLIARSQNNLKIDLELNKNITKGDYFAYPYGKYKDENMEVLEELGYRMAFTTNKGYVKPGDPVYELNRFGVFPTTNRIRFMQILYGIG